MKQRDAMVMAPAEIDAFLAQQRSSTVATLGPQGRIHLVGMWFAVGGHERPAGAGGRTSPAAW